MSKLGWVHMTFAIAAMLVGAAVVLRDKGSFAHRVTGWIYVSCMVGLNATALMIYRLFGHFGPFHVLALISLGTVVAGVSVAIFRPKGWLSIHYKAMSWSYIGLIAAAASEAGTRIRIFHFWWAVLIATGSIVGIGALIIKRTEKIIATKYRHFAEPVPQPIGA
jgi:uncharacterized membrane protein